MKSTGRPLRRRQSGVTLVVTLVFMVLFLLVAVAMVNSGLVNVKVAGNQQHSAEARDVAQQAIEQVISDDFTKAPVAVDVPVDVTGDGKADFVAQVAPPTCLTSQPVARVLDVENTSGDDECSLGVNTGNGNLVIGASGAGAVPSLCNDTQWEVKATVNDANGTGAAAQVHQGVAVRTLYGSTCP
ncbi:pilus assembly protein [Cupriavidus sp. SK-4]|nr:pilus assembly protein [Cupriavidus sp. SK-4]